MSVKVDMIIKKLLREALINEARVDINKDVDLLYNIFFKDTIDDIKLNGVLNVNKINEDKTYHTSNLKTLYCIEANDRNPCRILINYSGSGWRNFYKPDENLISLGFNLNAINHVLGYGGDIISAASVIPNGEQLKGEFTEEKIKGSINHELNHWLDDTFNNRHLKNKLDNRAKYGNDVFLKKQKVSDVNLSKFEIEGIIGNIVQLKRKYFSVWDDLTINDLVSLSPSLGTIKKDLYFSGEWSKYLKMLLTRMNREGLVGNNMR